MVNLILGISLTLNVITIIGVFIYFKVKVLGFKKFQKELESKFCSDKELDDMLDRL